ncbi:MAG: GntR family transcriptional regulator [Yoonia sp.]|uniref:GntR family transcriptional regulator n=1 Tax=Yoonia sp. TaxID=2212373 RepID=UPI00273DA509|nr:GntR family transcriptional regulator [Yoonia sp.]MDP5085661.1 GntR family transcriptional regulator [Yoonia sp.]
MAKTSTLPKFIQLSEMLIREIAAGHLVDGSRLPPERDMADDLGVAVGTLRKALADVEAKGLLDRVQGSGNYVRHRPAVDSVYAFFRLELLKGGGLPTAKVLSVERLPKPDTFAKLGGAPQGHRIRRLRSLDGILIALEEIWLDGGQRDVIAVSDLSDSLYHFYRHELGLVIASVEDRIGVAVMPDWTPAAFHLNAGDTVGYIERVSWTAAKHPAEFSRTWYDAKRATYISRMGKG